LEDGVGTASTASTGSGSGTGTVAFLDTSGRNIDLRAGTWVELVALFIGVEAGALVDFATVAFVDVGLVGKEHVGVGAKCEGAVGAFQSFITHATRLHGGVIATRVLAHFIIKINKNKYLLKNQSSILDIADTALSTSRQRELVVAVGTSETGVSGLYLHVVVAFVHLGLVRHEHIGVCTTCKWAVGLDVSLILCTTGGDSGVITATHLF
jgi:hypothetical protein